MNQSLTEAFWHQMGLQLPPGDQRYSSFEGDRKMLGEIIFKHAN
jgi:hypothetical protein